MNLPRCCANKVLLFDRESNLRLYEPCDIVLKHKCTFLGAWAPGRAEKIEIFLTRGHFSENFVNFANLDPSRSRATEFSWTSRLQNHNLHGLSSSWTAFHQDLTTGPRDIQVFVQKFSEKAHALLKWICPAVVPIKNCSSTKKAISVSTSHVILSWKANAPFRVCEPPAGPKKLSYISPDVTFPKILSEAANFDQILLFLEDWSGHSR